MIYTSRFCSLIKLCWKIWVVGSRFLFFLNTSILKCMFSCLFSHFCFFKWFSYVLTLEIDEITANIYTWTWLLFCIMGLYTHSHLYMEIYECLYHCKGFFWCSSNHTVQVYTQQKIASFLGFPSNILALQAVFCLQSFKPM